MNRTGEDPTREALLISGRVSGATMAILGLAVLGTGMMLDTAALARFNAAVLARSEKPILEGMVHGALALSIAAYMLVGVGALGSGRPDEVVDFSQAARCGSSKGYSVARTAIARFHRVCKSNEVSTA